MGATNAGGNDSSIPSSTPILASRPPSEEELLCHFVPPRPIVPETIPHVHDVRDSAAAQNVRQLHILVELRVLVAGGQHVVAAPDAFQEPRIVEPGQVVERTVQVGVVVVS